MGTLPSYQFSVNASDDARERMENATYQAYVDKLTPQYQQQINDLETSLDNMAIIKNVDCSYNNYTIVAEVTKNGELVSVKHSSRLGMNADVAASFGKMTMIIDMNIYEEYSSFTY